MLRAWVGHSAAQSRQSLAHRRATTDWRVLCAWVGHSAQTDPHRQSAEPAQARRRYNPFPSISVLTAATIGPEADSASVRVRAGDTRSACANTRATPSHLAAPFAPAQLPQHHRIPGTSATTPGTSAASLAHQYMQQTGRTRLVHTSSGSWPCEAVAHTASAERRLDADTTASVDIGAHSGDDRA